MDPHYNDVTMGAIASQITSLTIVYSIVYSDADQRKHQSSASLAFVRGIHRGPVNSPHTWPVTRKMFPFDDVIMNWAVMICARHVLLSFLKEGNDAVLTDLDHKRIPFMEKCLKCVVFVCTQTKTDSQLFQHDKYSYITCILYFCCPCA